MPRYQTVHSMSSHKRRRMRSALLISFHESISSIIPQEPESVPTFNHTECLDISFDIDVISNSLSNNSNSNEHSIDSYRQLPNAHINHMIPEAISSNINHCTIFSPFLVSLKM